MVTRTVVTFRAHLKRVITASFLTLGLAAAAAAFAIGFTGSFMQTLADPGSAPRMRGGALERLDSSLGYDGFLKTYRNFLVSRDDAQAAELRRFADDSDASLAAFARASLSSFDRENAAALRRLAAPFRRAALLAAGTSATLTTQDALERDYAGLKQVITAAAATADFDRIDDLSQALVWAQATSVGTLALLAIVLFALAWFLRDRLISPLEELRRSVASAAEGAVSPPLWGVERKDEIGAIARAADRLRQTAQSQALRFLPQLHLEVMEKLAQGATRLETDLSQMSAATGHARLRIEQASLRAAKASQAAAEAAELVRTGVARVAEQSEERMKTSSRQSRNVIDALVAAVTRLSHANARVGDRPPGARDFARGEDPIELGDKDAALVLEGLADGLDALEKFARERPAMADDQSVALTAALLQAVDRLNTITHRVARARGASSHAAG